MLYNKESWKTDRYDVEGMKTFKDRDEMWATSI